MKSSRRACAAILAAGMATGLTGAAGAESGPHVTGDVFVGSGHLQFDAHAAWAGRPAHGTLLITGGEAEDPQWHLLELTCVQIWGAHASMFGPIVASSDPSMEGKRFHLWVVDGGTPGSNGDLIVVADEKAAGGGGCPPNTIFAWAPVTDGNLVVHN